MKQFSTYFVVKIKVSYGHIVFMRRNLSVSAGNL